MVIILKTALGLLTSLFGFYTELDVAGMAELTFSGIVGIPRQPRRGALREDADSFFGGLLGIAMLSPRQSFGCCAMIYKVEVFLTGPTGWLFKTEASHRGGTSRRSVLKWIRSNGSWRMHFQRGVGA
jgi:hypothetical protein